MKNLKDIYKIFLEKLRLNSGSNAGHIYKMIFENLVPEEDMRYVLEYYLSVYNKEPDDWFRQFHKSLRQTDFITGIHAFRVIDKLDDNQRKRRIELLREASKLRKSNESNKLTSDKFDELKRLNAILNSEEDVDLGGIFDSIVWNVVYLDTENSLIDTFEKTFNEYQEKPKVKKKLDGQ